MNLALSVALLFLSFNVIANTDPAKRRPIVKSYDTDPRMRTPEPERPDTEARVRITQDKFECEPALWHGPDEFDRSNLVSPASR